MCFVRGLTRVVSAISMHHVFSSNIVQWIVVDELFADTTSFNFLNNSINGIVSLVNWDSAIYLLSVIDRAISVINLEHHMMGGLAYENNSLYST